MAQYSKLTNKQLVALLIEKDAKLVDLNTRLETLEAKFSLDSTFAERIVTLERSSYRQAQYSGRDAVEIVGLPESIEDQAALEKKVVEVFNHAGNNVTERDFHAIHRLKKNSVIIAKCVNRRDATAILRAKRKLRDTDEAAKKKLGVRGKIYVNESLCPEYSEFTMLSTRKNCCRLPTRSTERFWWSRRAKKRKQTLVTCVISPVNIRMFYERPSNVF